MLATEYCWVELQGSAEQIGDQLRIICMNDGKNSLRHASSSQLYPASAKVCAFSGDTFLAEPVRCTPDRGKSRRTPGSVSL
jgi:hypothetical protein